MIDEAVSQHFAWTTPELDSYERREERQRVLRLVTRYGYNATSFQTLESACRYWFAEDACVAYVDTGTAWVAAGAPIAEVTRINDIARDFVASARERGRRAHFFGVEARFLDATGFRSTRIASQPIWDPGAWTEGALKRSVREQLRRARAKNVEVRNLGAEELEATRGEVETAVEAWLESKPLARMGFLVAVELFHCRDERCYFVARRGGRIVGLLAAVPVYARRGWFCEDIVRVPSAPNGTTELLIHTAMVHFAAAGCRWATLGMVPLAGVDGWLRNARGLTSALYDFDGLMAFRAKFEPLRIDPLYVCHPGGLAPQAIIDVLRAFASGSLLSFGLASLARATTHLGTR